MNNLMNFNSNEIPEKQFICNFQSNEYDIPNYGQNRSINTTRVSSYRYPISRPLFNQVDIPTNIYSPAQYPTNNYLLQDNNPHYMPQTPLVEYGNNHVQQQSSNFRMAVSTDFAHQPRNFPAQNNANRNVMYSNPDIQVTPVTKAIKPNSRSDVQNNVDKNIEKKCLQTENKQTEPDNANISRKRQWDLSNDVSESKKKLFFPETKVFTGTIEYIFRWKKLNLPFHCLYQTIATCLNIKQGIRPASKLLLIREETGPVMQVIFYEMDNKLPMIRCGQLIRCVGRMIGANKLHALSIREAQINDKEALQRLTFISNHAINRSLKSAQ